jgi:hypothetical protein
MVWFRAVFRPLYPSWDLRLGSIIIALPHHVPFARFELTTPDSVFQLSAESRGASDDDGLSTVIVGEEEASPKLRVPTEQKDLRQVEINVVGFDGAWREAFEL